MNLLEDYEIILAKMKALEEIILGMQCEIYEQNQFEGNSKTFTHGSFKVSITKKENIKVDQTMASFVGFCFTSKLSLDKKAYKNLDDDRRKQVDECLTTSIGKPQFKLERIENGN